MITFPTDITAQLTELAARRRTSVSEQVRQAVYSWLDVFGKPADSKRGPGTATEVQRERERLVPFENL